MIFSSDFVTNSSSTSFVLITNDKRSFSLKKFFEAAQVDEKSPLAIIYRDLYSQINSAVSDNPVSCFEEIDEKYRSFGEFTKEGETEIRKRIANGEKAYVGTIGDDNSVGGYFMGKKVIIIGDDFYFNWEPDVY